MHQSDLARSFTVRQVRDRSWYDRHNVPVTKDGIMPFSRYVIRRKGVVEVGSGACLMCHARVMPDGSLLKGAQGNFPVDRILAANMRLQAERSRDSQALLESIRLGQRTFFSMPWLQPDPAARMSKMSLEEIATAYAAIPPGVSTRVNLNVFTPAQIPDLIGVADLRASRPHRGRASALDCRSDALYRLGARSQLTGHVWDICVARSPAQSNEPPAL